MKNYFKILSLILALLFTSLSCKKNKKEEETDPFNKTELLTNFGTNIIVPAYQKLLTDLENLELSYSTFSTSLSVQDLNNVKDKWLIAYLDWNNVNAYEFGPAMDLGIKSALGTFPTDTVKVESNIANGGYVLGSASNIDAIGFSVFDFLLYRENALTYFSSNSAYVNYGSELIQKMKSEIASVLNSWNSYYLTSFKNSTGTESTSSFSMLVNEYIKSYEQTKWTKVGIPIGKQSLGIQRPEYIEARNSKKALDLLKENMKSYKRLFNGDKLDGTTGIGFDDYLIALDKASLAATINSNFSSIIADIEGISSSFEEVMQNNPQLLDNLYTKIHNLTVFLKTDMSSAFGVLITYQDNDGD